MAALELLGTQMAHGKGVGVPAQTACPFETGPVAVHTGGEQLHATYKSRDCRSIGVDSGGDWLKRACEPRVALSLGHVPCLQGHGAAEQQP